MHDSGYLGADGRGGTESRTMDGQNAVFMVRELLFFDLEISCSEKLRHDCEYYFKYRISPPPKCARMP